MAAVWISLLLHGGDAAAALRHLSLSLSAGCGYRYRRNGGGSFAVSSLSDLRTSRGLVAKYRQGKQKSDKSEMAASSSSNSKAAGYAVNSSSMLSLLSEVSKHADGHKRGSTFRGAAATGEDELGGRKGAGGPKKGSIFDRANRGIESRSARDRSHMLAREDLSVEARRVLKSREKMEKKALLYEKLAKGEGLKGASREQLREGLLVDFETKAIEESYNDRSSESSEEDDSDGDEDQQDAAKKAKPEGEDDPVGFATATWLACMHAGLLTLPSVLSVCPARRDHG